MNVLPNTDTIKIPMNPSREWIWYRILISVDYYLLKKPTALQWALIKILFNIDKFQGEVTSENVASKLAVEKAIVEEGLNNLLDEKLVILQPRKKNDVLQNYSLNENIKETFSKHELIPYAKNNKKLILFYDYKDERTFQYQTVDRSEDDQNEVVDEELFELVLLSIIETVWEELDKNPHSLVGEIEFPQALGHRFLKDLQSIKFESIRLNFL